MRRHLPLDVDTALARLAQRVDSLAHDLADLARLRGIVESHGRALTRLSDLVAAGHDIDAAAPPSGGDPDGDEDALPAPEWLTVTDPAQAVAWLNGLTVWVPRVWALYPSSRLTDCWPWHPPIVAELLVSQHLWLKAVNSGPAPDALAAWHDRWRPAVAVRVTRSLSGCERGGGCHVNPAGHHYLFDRDYLDDLAVWWASGDRHDLDAAPGLVRERDHDRYGREGRR